MTEIVDGIRSAELSFPPAEPSPRVAAKTEAHPGHFERLVHDLGRDIRHGEALVERALHAGYERLDAGMLIALQAGIYRYSEAIDLTVKLVDRATGAVKTVLETR